MRKFLEIGGLIAGVVLIAFGTAAIVLGVNGRARRLGSERLTGNPQSMRGDAAGSSRLRPDGSEAASIDTSCTGRGRYEPRRD